MPTASEGIPVNHPEPGAETTIRPGAPPGFAANRLLPPDAAGHPRPRAS